MKKKTYNPFKMWGTWIGAIGIPLFLDYNELFGRTLNFNQFIAEFLPFFVMGFLIGWGIHAIFRKLKRRSH